MLPVLDVVPKYPIPELTVVARARQTLLTALKKVGKVASRARQRCCTSRIARVHDTVHSRVQYLNLNTSYSTNPYNINKVCVIINAGYANVLLKVVKILLVECTVPAAWRRSRPRVNSNPADDAGFTSLILPSLLAT